MKGIIIPLTEEEFEAHLQAAVKRALESYVLPKDDVKYLTRQEVADKLRISLPTLHAYKRKGVLKYYHIQGRVLFREDEIEELLESGSFKYRR